MTIEQIGEVKDVLDRIIHKKENVERFLKLKDWVDNRTEPTGLVKVTVEGESFFADPTDVKKLLNKQIDDNDATADLAELKLKTQ